MNINKLDENSQVKIRDSKFDSDKAYNYGSCININVCECEGTNHKGLYCNEFYELNRPKLFDTIAQIIAFLLMAISLILIIGLYIYRKDPRIKACKYQNLLLILNSSC